MATYDYVIVGAGSAGCVLAHRLSEDPATKVLLIEAGGPDRHPFIHMPRALAKIMGNMRYIWPFMTEAEHASNDAGEFWARGRTLGGSSAINGMMYVRGHSTDFDDLAALSSEDWNWKKMGAAYKAMETHQLGSGRWRGDSGPLRISLSKSRPALSEALIDACAALGMQRVEDVNEPAPEERAGYAQWTISGGKRQSAATAFLKPVMDRSNLTVIDNVVIDKVIFDGSRAIGVAGSRNGDPVSIAADQDVIISAGALASPAILQRSGVGPAALLSELAIPVVHANASVGANLREHRGIVLQWKTADKYSENRDYRGLNLLTSAAKYFLFKDGPMTKGAFDIGGWFKSRPDLERPDAQILLSPFSFDYSSATPRVEGAGGVICCVYMLRPDCSGSVTIGSTDPSALPVIDANYRSAGKDARFMADLIRHVRKLMRQAPLTEFGLEETRPGSKFETDDELREAYRQMGYTNYHACGTCRLGKDRDSVLDPQLRVRGVSNLRVVDASIFPFIPAGNTNAPVMATAWRAADIIKSSDSSSKPL